MQRQGTHGAGHIPLKKKIEFCATYRVLHIPALRNFSTRQHFPEFDIQTLLLMLAQNLEDPIQTEKKQYFYSKQFSFTFSLKIVE